MYTVMVKKDFIAAHWLVGGDWGDENKLHNHHYNCEVLIEGRELDKHGYLVDISEIDKQLTKLTSYFKNQSLNKLPEFADLNPSLERFAQVLGERLVDSLTDPSGSRCLHSLTVRLWENEQAWASFRLLLEKTVGRQESCIC